MLKIMLIAACIGHIVCGITDCMLAYTPDGRFDMSKDTKDPERMKKKYSVQAITGTDAGISFLFLISAVTVRAARREGVFPHKV